MKKLLTLGLTLTLTLFIFAGCANKSEVQPNAMMSDISKFKKSPLSETTYYYIKEGTDFSKYNNVVVPQINILVNQEDKNEVNEKLLEDVSNYFTIELENQLQNIVQDKRFIKNTLIFNASIISLEVSYDDLEIYQYLPYGLAFTALKRGTGLEGKKLRVHLALKVTDKKTKETIAQVIERNIIEDNIKDYQNLTIDNITPTINTWIKKYSIRLKELKEGKYKL